MARTIRRVLTAAGMAVALVGTKPLAAQDLSVSSAFEAAGDEVYVVFVQPTIGFGPEEGWRPDVGVGAYHVWTAGEDTWGITPAVGLGYRTAAGMIQIGRAHV